MKKKKKKSKMNAIAAGLMAMGYGLDGDNERFIREVKDEYEARKRNGDLYR
jgi:hypothetical protein